MTKLSQSEHFTKRAPMFIPKRLQKWQPTRVSHQRCHWCTSGPHPVRQLGVVMEGMMRYQFCSENCHVLWQQLRHDADVVEWLKMGRGERAKVLAEAENETTPAHQAACRRALAGLRIDNLLALSVCSNTELPQASLFPERGCRNSDSGA